MSLTIPLCAVSFFEPTAKAVEIVSWVPCAGPAGHNSFLLRVDGG